MGLRDELDEASRVIAALTAERDSLRSGHFIDKLQTERDRLARFAVECERWGAAPCQCMHRAGEALDDAGVRRP